MGKMTKDEARAELKAAKTRYSNREISFDQYVAIKKRLKAIIMAGDKDA